MKRLHSLVSSSPDDDMLVPMDAIALVDGMFYTSTMRKEKREKKREKKKKRRKAKKKKIKKKDENKKVQRATYGYWIWATWRSIIACSFACIIYVFASFFNIPMQRRKRKRKRSKRASGARWNSR